QSQRERDHQNAFRRQMEQAKGIIQSAVDALTEIVSETNEEASKVEGAFDPKKVFIVHGHNESVKQSVARTLDTIGLTPIILAEQPDKGRTVIEKFEKEGNDVGFAVVLLTADDKGRKNRARSMQSRARQNVVFEMGYFMALLGRERVMLLLQEGVEEPSDLKGIVYTSLDKDGAWKFRLVKELQEQGYNVSSDTL
ncbi:MAG: nucleotide-binding protein, partial [Bacteroidaceae bacterium]|nr:nucleotide-binding protein [Bacteroidaceae bacterium]